jgi:hypothetical protein
MDPLEALAQYEKGGDEAKPAPKSSPDNSEGTNLTKTLLGGFESPADYANYHSSRVIQGMMKNTGGMVSIDDALKAYEDQYTQGEKLLSDERSKQIDAGIDIQKQEQLKLFDTYKTRQPTDAERDEAASLSYSWNGLKDLERAYYQARESAPAWTGPVGANLAHFTDDHGVLRGFIPDQVKAFNTTASANAGPILQGIMKYTAGADAKANVMNEVIPNLMPSLQDSVGAFNAKMEQLRTAAARRAQSFVASRGGNNSAGNPAVDMSSVQSALGEPLQYLQALEKKTAQQTSNTTTPNSVFTQDTQDAFNQVKNAALRNTQRNPVPLDPNGGANVASPQSPNPPPSPQANNAPPDWFTKIFGGGPSALGGT